MQENPWSAQDTNLSNESKFLKCTTYIRNNTSKEDPKSARDTNVAIQ